jgi:hypothetical protein
VKFDLYAAERMSAFGLAVLADTGSPDTRDSRGAEFLCSVRDTLVSALDAGESIESARLQATSEAGEMSMHGIWAAFTDLALYEYDLPSSQDPIEPSAENLESILRVSLTTVADRLCDALIAKISIQS